jgi:hypothetical protein
VHSSGAMRVAVHSCALSTPSADYVITNPVGVHDLIALANALREMSLPSPYTMPAPQITATFYNGSDFVGAIEAGSNFLFVSFRVRNQYARLPLLQSATFNDGSAVQMKYTLQNCRNKIFRHPRRTIPKKSSTW